MKTKLIPVMLLALLALYLQGCCSTTYCRMVNTEQLLNKHGYQSSNMNFKMRSSDLNDPTFSRKGQVSLMVNAGGGAGGNLSIATGEKSAIYFKGSSRTANDDWYNSDTMKYMSSTDGQYWSGPYDMDVSIQTNHSLHNGFFETGLGTFKMNVAKNLRYVLLSGIATEAESQGTFKNELSVGPFTPIFHHVQLVYTRQIDTTIRLGLQSRYYFSTPPTDYDSIHGGGGDATFFAKLKFGKSTGGWYTLMGVTAGYYNLMAGYGHTEPGWFGDFDYIPYAEQRSFFTFGGNLLLGYQVIVHRFTMDFASGIKFLTLPKEVTEPVHGEKLLNLWGNYSWTDLSSPGSIFSLSITVGYLF